MAWALKKSAVKANASAVWDGLTNVSLSLERGRIHWPSPPNTDGFTWKLAGGTFREKHFLALAVKSSNDQTDKPLVFQTYHLGNDTKEESGFKPGFST